MRTSVSICVSAAVGWTLLAGSATAQLPASPMLSPTVPVGETQVGDCQMGFGEPYRCTFEGLKPKSGYSASVRVTDIFNTAPTLDLDVISHNVADVWANMGGEWFFVGTWETDLNNSNCLVPGSVQTTEAWDNMGQDAWQLCLLR